MLAVGECRFDNGSVFQLSVVPGSESNHRQKDPHGKRMDHMLFQLDALN